MSFGPSQQTKNAMNAENGASQQAVSNSTAQMGQGNNLLGTGGSNVTAGTNFFNTLLNGNANNTQSLLQPNIDQIKQANNNAISSASALMPRGGGRYGSLFSSTYAPNQQIQSLFNGARSGAASNLASLGLQQQGLGTNLFGTANSALGTGLQGQGMLANQGIQNTQASNSLASGLGGGLFSLLTAPISGLSGGSLFGAGMKGLGGLFGGG